MIQIGSKSSREIIQNVFSPMVAVISSPNADELCLKNNLSFVEMLQPFCKLTSDGKLYFFHNYLNLFEYYLISAHFRDTSGVSVSVKGLHINLCDIDWRPPQTMLARKMLNESVANSATVEHSFPLKINDELVIDIPETMPWFDRWRETFFNVQFPADHEFTRHLLSSLIVVSSTDPNPLETAMQLTQKVQSMQTVVPAKLPKWFHSEVLNCYIMVHDGCTGDISK